MMRPRVLGAPAVLDSPGYCVRLVLATLDDVRDLVEGLLAVVGREGGVGSRR